MSLGTRATGTAPTGARWVITAGADTTLAAQPVGAASASAALTTAIRLAASAQGAAAASAGLATAIRLAAPATGTAAASAAMTSAIRLAVAAQAIAQAVADLSAGPAIYRPSADVSAGGWTATPGGTLASCVDEASADDGDYITSPNASSPAVLSMTPAMPAGNQTIRVRAARTGSTGQLRVRLLDGSNVDVGGTDWQALTTTPTTYSLAATTTALANRYRIEVQP